MNKRNIFKASIPPSPHLSPFPSPKGASPPPSSPTPSRPGMRDVRRRAVEAARGARRWALVLGTLGRQGNPHILDMLQVCVCVCVCVMVWEGG